MGMKRSRRVALGGLVESDVLFKMRWTSAMACGLSGELRLHGAINSLLAPSRWLLQ